MTHSAQDVTELLNQWVLGNQATGEKVLPLVYDELRRIVDFSEERAAEEIALDDALTALSELHQRQSRLVELRFFWGVANSRK